MRSHSDPPLQEDVKSKKCILWFGDAVASTGFAQATHSICDALHATDKYDIHIVGINYFGDPHPYPYKIYPCSPGGDTMGYGRVRGMVRDLQPDVIVLQNDPWNIQRYLKDKDGSKVGSVPTIGYIAIDGKNCDGGQLNGLTHSVFWTQFAQDEAHLRGYTGPSSVIPLGVDQNVFYPQDRAAVRERMQMERVFSDRGMPPDSFVVGVVGRNQWRKRLDLVVEYFAEWVHTRNVDNACLWIHSAPTNDDAWDLDQLADYYDVRNRVLIPLVPKNLAGLETEKMARCYNMFDVLFTATLGEGFWLPGFEAAACSTPIIAPDYSAVGELFKDAAQLVPCTSTAVHPNQTNTIGGVMDKQWAVEALHALCSNREQLKFLGRQAYARVSEERFRWHNIGKKFEALIDQTLTTTDAWTDLMAPAHAD